MVRKLAGLMVIGALLLAGCGGTATQAPAPQTEQAPVEEATEAAPVEEQPTEEAAPDEGRTLVFVDINDDPVESLDRYQPLMDYLAANLADYGITGGEVRVAPDIETATQWMADGEVDLFFDSVYPALSIVEQTGAQVILRRWRSGVGEYKTVIFAKAGSGVESLEDLQGKIIAYDEPSSSTGYFLPTAMLLDAGISSVELPDVEAEVPADQVGYVFSNDDENTLQWVISDLVAAGATDNVTYEEDLPQETRDQLVIIAESILIPRQVVLAKADMEADLLDAIKALLIGLEGAEGGADILDAARTTKFDEFPGGAEAALAEVRALFDLVTGQ